MADNQNHFSMEDLTTLAKSAAGRELYAQLRQSNEDTLRRAMSLAASGDMNGAGAILAPLLSDPRIRDLVTRLGGQ